MNYNINKRRNRIFSIFLLTVLLFSTLPISQLHVSAEASNDDYTNEETDNSNESLSDDVYEEDESDPNESDDNEILEPSKENEIDNDINSDIDEDLEKGNQENHDESVNDNSDGSSSIKNKKSSKSSNNTSINMMSAKSTSLTLKNGDRHAKVKELKRNLKKAGFAVPGNGTTLYGKETEKKVREFQSYYKLTADGIAGTTTFNKLSEVVNSPLQNGKRHAQTKTLKADLKSIGYPVPGNGTTLYGKDTEAVIKKFQKDYKLKVNGIADEITLQKINDLIKEASKPQVDPNNLKNGDRHAKVKELKRDLKKAGFPVPGNGTTLFGKDTEQKVKEFQRYYNLSADGIARKSTFDKLAKVVNSPLQNGKKHAQTKTLKADLKTIGYPVPGKGTTLYGKDTEAVIKKFQKDYKLTVNGIADEITLQKISDLKKEASKPQVDPNNLKNGDRHAKVKELKRDLKKAGFPVPGNGTTLFGNDTETKVKAFQKYYNLSTSGVANTSTFNKLSEVVNSPLQKGMKHAQTKTLKADLKAIGYPVPGTGTTLYGKDTETVVKRFQRDYGLIQNGIADSVTLQKIANLKKNPPKTKIFIDAGHGGSDPGASGNGLKEKDLTLDIAKRIEKHLKQYKNVDIKMARTTDITLKNPDKVKMANNWGADFYFSVHINSFTSSSAHGFESFIWNGPPTKDEKEKQTIIHDNIVKNMNFSADRGKKDANFHVLRESNMTAMLVEYLFITNKNDSSNLKNPNYRDRLAKHTADGIAKAYNLKK